MSQSTATSFGQLVFWGAYVLGSLSLVYSWLLAQVPRPLGGADLRLDYAVRSGAAFLLLICVLSAKRLWNIRKRLTEAQDGPGRVTMFVIGAACLELALSLYWIAILTTYR